MELLKLLWGEHIQRAVAPANVVERLDVFEGNPVRCRPCFESDGAPHAVIHQDGADPDHFRSDYFRPGTDWHLPALAQPEHGYAQAREAYEAAGRTITNGTPGTALEVFDRGELDKLLASASKELAGA